ILGNMELRPWAVPENVNISFEVYIEEDQEELIFGAQDEDLQRIEAHSRTFIQLESGFTAAGQTRVLVAGQLESWLWLLCMILSITSDDPRSFEMLQLVRSRPLTPNNLADPYLLLLDLLAEAS
uniref:KH-like RNA-binding domain-containing protein n=1 Tax=Catagonus wagneri TaxID=51154 RepID=A0A8C3W9F6_9CETA